MTALLIASVILGQTKGDPKIDLELPGVSMTKLATILADKTGQPFVVDKEMANEVVAIYVKGMPLSEVLERVGKVSYGKWVSRTDGMRLIYDRDRVKRFVSANMAPYRAELKEARRAYRAWKVRKGGGDGSTFFNTFLEQLNGPEGAIWQYAYEALPDEALLPTDSPHPIVYSTQPTQFQRRIVLPDVSALVAKLNQEQRHPYWEGSNEKGTKVVVEIRSKSIQDALDFVDDPTYCEGEIVVKLVNSAGYSFPILRLTPEFFVMLMGKKPGTELDRSEPSNASVSISLPDTFEYSNDWEHYGLAFTYHQSPPKEYDDDGNELPAKVKPPVPQTWMDMVLHPEVYEPLAYTLGMPLIEAAKIEGKQVIADLDDKSFGDFMYQSSIHEYSHFADEVKSWVESCRDQGAVWMCETNSPLHNPGDRIDRNELGEYVRSRYERGAPNLAKDLDFVLQNTGNADNWLYTSYESCVCSYQLPDSWGTDNPENYRIWSVIGAGARNQLRQGYQVPLERLSAAAYQSIERLILDGTFSLVAHSYLGPESPSLAFQDLQTFRCRMSSGRGYDMTEVLANGLPRGGYLRAWVKSQPCLVEARKDGGSRAVFAPDRMACQLLFAEVVKETPIPMLVAAQDQRFNLGKRELIHVACYLPGNKGFCFDLDDVSEVDQSHEYTLNHLPKAFESALNGVRKVASRSESLQQTIQFYKQFDSDADGG